MKSEGNNRVQQEEEGVLDGLSAAKTRQTWQRGRDVARGTSVGLYLRCFMCEHIL